MPTEEQFSSLTDVVITTCLDCDSWAADGLLRQAQQLRKTGSNATMVVFTDQITLYPALKEIPGVVYLYTNYRFGTMNNHVFDWPVHSWLMGNLFLEYFPSFQNIILTTNSVQFYSNPFSALDQTLSRTGKHIVLSASTVDAQIVTHHGEAALERGCMGTDNMNDTRKLLQRTVGHQFVLGHGSEMREFVRHLDFMARGRESPTCCMESFAIATLSALVQHPESVWTNKVFLDILESHYVDQPPYDSTTFSSFTHSYRFAFNARGQLVNSYGEPYVVVTMVRNCVHWGSFLEMDENQDEWDAHLAKRAKDPNSEPAKVAKFKPTSKYSCASMNAWTDPNRKGMPVGFRNQ
jgi:hypothetical protein